MRVSIDFDRPFSGLVFSKGHFSDPSCVHLQPGLSDFNIDLIFDCDWCPQNAPPPTQGNLYARVDPIKVIWHKLHQKWIQQTEFYHELHKF